MKVLITGSNGLLGQKLINELKIDSNIKIIATSKGKNRIVNKSGYTYESLDVTKLDDVKNIFKKYTPNVVINTAAMTNVDRCEDDKIACDKLNVEAVLFLADTCLDYDAHLIHISTDFIFDGKNGPYSEDDVPNPLSYYGLSKLKSENLLYNHNVKWSILRTIIIFGVAEKLNKSNIVLWAKESLQKEKSINVVDDQFRAPTLAEDLASACIQVAKNKVYGIFNVSGKDIMSIYEIVERVAKYFGYSTKNLNKISTSELNQKAIRPKRTGFVLDKAKNTFDYRPRSFEHALNLIEKQLEYSK